MHAGGDHEAANASSHASLNRFPQAYALAYALCVRAVVVYYAVGSGINLLLAFTVTAATFISLTLFTLITPLDWNFMYPFIFVGALLILLWAILAPLLYCCGTVPNGLTLVRSLFEAITSTCPHRTRIQMTLSPSGSPFSQFFGIVGTIVFSGFIIYDTNNIMRYLGLDDFIIASVELYLDVVNLFLCILTLFQVSSN